RRTRSVGCSPRPCELQATDGPASGTATAPGRWAGRRWSRSVSCSVACAERGHAGSACRVGSPSRPGRGAGHRRAAGGGVRREVQWGPCWRVGNGKKGEGVAADTYRGGDVVAEHATLGGVRNPGQVHRSGQLRRCAPAGTTVGGGDESGGELAGRRGA